MELSSEERIKLVEMKEQIYIITEKILSNLHNEKNGLSMITGMNKILSILTTIASYSESKSHDLGKFTDSSRYIILRIDFSSEYGWDNSAKYLVEVWCTAVNSIVFNFNKQPIFKLPIDINKIFRDLSKMDPSKFLEEKRS